MAATVVLAEVNGPSLSATETLDVVNINFGADDSAELNPATHPVTAQVDGHSFEKWLRFYVSDLGGSTQVDNFKVWISNLGGGWATGEGVSCNLRTTGYVQASYPSAGPVETDSTDATETMPEAEPTGPNLGIGGSLTGSILATPAYSDYMVLQLDVSDLTPAGALNTKTFTFQWDEF